MKKSKHKAALPRPRYVRATDDFEYDEDNFELPDFYGYDHEKVHDLLYEWPMNKAQNLKKKLIIADPSAKILRTIIKQFEWGCCVFSADDFCTVQTKGRYCVASAGGDNGEAKAIGMHSVAMALGFSGKAVVTSRFSVALSTGDEGCALLESTSDGVAVAMGMRGVAGSDKDSQAVLSTGSKGKAFTAGEKGIAITTGEEGKASALSSSSVAISTGMYASARGVLGAWIVVAGYHCDGSIECIKSAEVDRVSVKPDVYYAVVNGELVEAQDPPVRFAQGYIPRR